MLTVRKPPFWVSDDLVAWTFVRGAVERGAEGAWNRHNFWAPEILAHDGRNWLYYTAKSQEDEQNHTNRVGLAVADSPDGPFVESETIIMHSSDLVKGPGHHNFFPGPDGKTWVVYHGWDPAMTTRYPRIDRIEIALDGELTSPAPTSTPQALL